MSCGNHSPSMGCQIAVAPAMLRAVRLSCDRARFLTDHAYDYDQTQTIDAERSASIADLADSRPRCAQALRRGGSPSHALRRVGGQPEDEDQSALEGEDQAMRSTRPAHRACRAGRVAAEALILRGESGALAHRSRELVILGERGRTREPGQRGMSARTIRTVTHIAEPPAKGPSCQMNTRAAGLHRGERPPSGFTPPDRALHLLFCRAGSRFLVRRFRSARTDSIGEYAVTRSRCRLKAVASLIAKAVTHGRLVVFLNGPWRCAWCRGRRTHYYYASKSSSKRSDLAAAWSRMPDVDCSGGPPGTADVLGNGSRIGSRCIQVGRHHGARFRAVARIERRAVAEQEYGCLAAGCMGKPPVAFASSAIPCMRIAGAGSASEVRLHRKGTTESNLKRRVCASRRLMAASRRPAGGCPTFSRRGSGRLILFGDFSEAKIVTVPHVQRLQISFWTRRFRPAAKAGRKDGIVAYERSEDIASAATVRRLGPFIRNRTTTMGLDNLPIRCGCPEHRHRPKLFGGITHDPNEPCPFDDYGIPVGAFGSCCALRGQATASELQSLGENLLAQGLYKDMSCAEALLFARELRMAAERIEREYAGDTTLEYEEQWDFEAALATIRTTARWYERVANLGFGVFAWS